MYLKGLCVPDNDSFIADPGYKYVHMDKFHFHENIIPFFRNDYLESSNLYKYISYL